jgi:hypothetical protein
MSGGHVHHCAAKGQTDAAYAAALERIDDRTANVCAEKHA